MNENNVLEKVCIEKHRSVDDKLKSANDRLNSHSARIDSVEDAVIRLTNLVESMAKKDIFDKILTLSVFIISLVLAAMILGPQITGKILGGLK